jgi:hypothetical protein
MLKKAETIARLPGAPAESQLALWLASQQRLSPRSIPGRRARLNSAASTWWYGPLSRRRRRLRRGSTRDCVACSERATSLEDVGGRADDELTHRAEHSGAYAGSALSSIAGEINPAIEVAAELRPQSGIGVVGV